MLDLKVVGGQIVDGTGAAAVRADLGMTGDTITAVGDLEREPGRTIDAAGLTVTPGFIDVHSHSDWRLSGNRRAESKIRQGVTTEVVGNCGFSSAPVSDEFHEEMRGFALSLPPGMDFSWRSMADLGTPRVTLSPQMVTLDYRVSIEVQTFESAPGQMATLDAVWILARIVDSKSRIGRTTVREPARDCAAVRGGERGLAESGEAVGHPGAGGGSLPASATGSRLQIARFRTRVPTGDAGSGTGPPTPSGVREPEAQSGSAR
jgi:hypothetical protein